MDDRHFDQTAAKEWIEIVEGEHGRKIREGDLYPYLRKWMAHIKPSRILDIGCGQGACSEKIDLDNCTYVGVDPSSYLLERAMSLHANGNRQFISGSAYALPFPDASFDAAFSVAVWHLLEEKEKAASELSRVLREDGHFMIVAANPAVYDEWTKTYSSGTSDGLRFEGRTRQQDGSESVDVLYLHSYEQIVATLQSAHLEVHENITFRTALCIRGKKRSAQ